MCRILIHISGCIIGSGVGEEVCATVARSLLRTSWTHESAVGCVASFGGLPIPRLTDCECLE